MRKTLLQLSFIVLCLTGIQDTLVAQEKTTSLNQVVNNPKDVIGNLMIYPLDWLSIGGSSIHGTGHAIADSEYTRIKTGENYAKKRWSAGAVVTTPKFNLHSEYLGGKDRNVKSEGFYATGSVRFAWNFDFIASYDYFNPNKATDFKQNNYIAGVQYWFYHRCRLQAQYTFCDKKGNGQKRLQSDTGTSAGQVLN